MRKKSMSFICADGEIGNLFDVLPDWKLGSLIHYFKESPYTQDVDFLVTDINAAYYQLIPKVFNNAQLIIDLIHVVKHINKTFDDFRILEVKRLTSTGINLSPKGEK